MLNSCTVPSPARLGSDTFGRFHLQNGATDGFPGLRPDKSTAWTAAKPRIDYSSVIFHLFPLPRTHNSQFNGRSSKSPLCTLVSNNTSITNGASRWHMYTSHSSSWVANRAIRGVFVAEGKNANFHTPEENGDIKANCNAYIIPKKVFK